MLTVYYLPIMHFGMKKEETEVPRTGNTSRTWTPHPNLQSSCLIVKPRMLSHLDLGRVENNYYHRSREPCTGAHYSIFCFLIYLARFLGFIIIHSSTPPPSPPRPLIFVTTCQFDARQQQRIKLKPRKADKNKQKNTIYCIDGFCSTFVPRFDVYKLTLALLLFPPWKWRHAL